MDPVFDKDFTRNVISEGSVNPKIIKDFFYDIKLKSYDYCYLIQDELVDLMNQYFPDCIKVVSNDRVEKNCFTQGKHERVVVFNIDKAFVHQTRRREYKYSKVYGKCLSYDDIEENKSLFKFTPILYVDNKIVHDIRVKCREDVTDIFVRYGKFQPNMVTPKSKANILFLSQSMKDSITLHSGDIEQNTIKGEKFKYNLQFKNYQKYIGYLNKDKYQIFLNDIDYDSESKTFKFNSSIPGNYDGMELTVIALGDYLTRKDFTASDKYFSVDIQRMPTPKSNMLIMIKDTDGLNYYPNDGSIELKEYYPNIYEIINPKGLAFSIYVLYDNSIENEEIKYDNEIEFYLSKVDLLQRFQSGTVPSVLKEYKPVKWDYLIKDYYEKYKGDMFSEDHYNSFRYKLEKVSSIYKLWSLFFQVYVRRTYGFLPGYLMDMKDYDLEAKTRVDTSQEIPMSEEVYHSFDEECVVFVYKTSSELSNLSYLFYVDGRVVDPYIITYDGYMYVYIPKKFVNPTSFIEVERFDGVKFIKPIKIEEGPVEVLMDFLPTNILFNSLYLVDDTGEYYNIGETDDFLISVVDIIGTFDIKNRNSVYIINPLCKLRLTPLTERAKNRTIELRCNNELVLYRQLVNGDDFATDNEEELEFNFVDMNKLSYVKDAKYGLRGRLRFYNTDGRMFSKRVLRPSNILQTTNVRDRIAYSFPINPGKIVNLFISYIGYDERLVYRQNKIEPKNVICLEGKLKRPFSLTYYDCYINGIRLTKNNIQIVSPFYIYLKNIDVVDDFEIYEKIRPAYDVYEFEDGEESDYIADNLFKDDEEFQDKVIEDIEEIITNPDIEDLDDIVDQFLNLIKDFILSNFVNADLKYDLHDFEDLFDPNWDYRLYLNADHRLENEVPRKRWAYLNHDKSIAQGDKPSNNYN